MKDIIIKCPINQLSYGNISFNILKEIHKLGMTASIFPVSNKVDISVYDKIQSDFMSWLQDSINHRNLHTKRNFPCLNIWHIAGSEQKISDKNILYTFHETDSSTEAELNLCNLYDKTIFSSSFSHEIFKSNGLTNSDYSNPGFDFDFHKNESFKLKNKIHFGIMGKWESRKNTSRIIKLWVKEFGNDNRYQLSCCVNNSFLTEKELEELRKESIDNRDITNINFLPFLEKNSQVKQYLNSTDIDLGGMSGAEGWNLPSFNATCLGAWSIVLNATAHKDWATKDNCILIEPSGKTDIFDGRFFKGEEFNIGCKYDFNDQDFIQAMHLAVNKVKNNIKNTKGQELKDKFTYKKTLENILKHF